MTSHLTSPKKQTKLTILSTFSTQDSKLHSFFERTWDVIICFRNLLTFTIIHNGPKLILKKLSYYIVFMQLTFLKRFSSIFVSWKNFSALKLLIISSTNFPLSFLNVRFYFGMNFSSSSLFVF